MKNLWAIFFLTTLFAVHAIEGERKYEYIPYFAAHYSSHTGLPDAGIEDVVQDRFGLLYFRTNDKGLLCYDGYSWVELNRENAGLFDNAIVDMVYDGADTIYLAHKGMELTLFDIISRKGEKMVYERPDLNFQFNIINLMLFRNKYLAISSNCCGMYLLDLSTKNTEYFPGSNPELNIYGGGWPRISESFTDTGNVSWFGTTKGVMQFSGSAIAGYYPFEDNVERTIQQLFELTDGTLLVVTDRFIGFVDKKKEVVREYKEVGIFNKILETQAVAAVNSLVYDGKGRLLLGTTGGVAVFDPETREEFLLLYENGTILSDYVISLFVDREKSIWVITLKGISKLRYSAFFNVEKINGLSVSNARFDTFGQLEIPFRFKDNIHGAWLIFSTDMFIAEFSGSGYKVIDSSFLGEGGRIRRLGVCSNTFFIQPWWSESTCVYNEELSAFVTKAIPEYADYHLDNGYSEFYFYSESGLYEYLIVRDKRTGAEKKNRIMSDQRLQPDRLEFFFDREDSDKVWLIQTGNRAVAFFYDIVKRRVYEWPLAGMLRDALGHPVNNIFSTIKADRWGGFWLLYMEDDNRIFHYEENGLKDYTSLLGLEGRRIINIAVDSSGNLVVATESNGLLLYDGNSVKRYTMSDGLPSNRISGGVAISGDDHIIAFTGDFISILDHEYTQPRELNLVFTEIRSVGVEHEREFLLSKEGEVELKPQLRDISVYLSSGSYLAENNQWFEFFLKGVHSEWTSPSRDNFITLTSLAPGKYTLRARVTDYGGITDEAFLSFRVPPLWHEKNAVRILLGLLIIGMVSLTIHLIVVWYTGRLKKKAEHLEKVVDERTRQLRKTQQELIELGQMVGKADIAEEVLHAVGNIINSMNLSSSEIERILGRNTILKMEKAKELVNEEDFLNRIDDIRVKQVLDYYGVLGESLKREHGELLENNSIIQEKMLGLQNLLNRQEQYVHVRVLNDDLLFSEILDESLKFLSSELEGIEVIQNCENCSGLLVRGQRSRLLFILVNLLKNSINALRISVADLKRIVIDLYKNEDLLYFSIADTGVGITSEKLSSIFNMNPSEGKGQFSLHTCSNYMREMKGSISASSDGPGKGAVFFLQFPLAPSSRDEG